jgi:hypothetical protein
VQAFSQTPADGRFTGAHRPDEENTRISVHPARYLGGIRPRSGAVDSSGRVGVARVSCDTVPEQKGSKISPV